MNAVTIAIITSPAFYGGQSSGGGSIETGAILAGFFATLICFVVILFVCACYITIKN